MSPKLNPIFNLEEPRRREVIPRLSDSAQYAKELWRSGLKMVVALREASKLYGVDIHSLASELGIRGGKSKRRERKW